MTKTFRLGILRGRHDTTQPTIADNICSDLLIQNSNDQAVFQFWKQNTHDYLDIQAQLLPWVDFTMSATLAANRKQLAQTIFDATKLLTTVTGFDGFAILVFPGQIVVPAQPGQPATTININPGTERIENDTLRASVLSVATSDHTFMTHEVGHVLGFVHTYGLLNNGSDWDQQPPWQEGNDYGSPYDIMSSATFATRNLDPAVPHWTGRPTFAGTAVAGWPTAAAFNTMGCAAARANVHFWDEQGLPGQRAKIISVPFGTPLPRVRLYRASSTVDHCTLVVLKSALEGADKVGRVYVEFRDTTGWDRGLDTAGETLHVARSSCTQSPTAKKVPASGIVDAF